MVLLLLASSVLNFSGKSTLIGVLSSSGLDDGRGAARSLVLRHRHEQENGRTSAVTMEIMGYSKDGQQVSIEWNLERDLRRVICSRLVFQVDSHFPY